MKLQHLVLQKIHMEQIEFLDEVLEALLLLSPAMRVSQHWEPTPEGVSVSLLRYVES